MSVNRSQRVGDRIREELARLLSEEVRDPGVGFVTITGVDLSPDMRNARVHVSALGKSEETVLRALRRATPFLRRGLARRAGLRFTPELRFAIDPSIAQGSRVDRLLREIQDEHGELAATDDPTEPTERDEGSS
jgi:ribosome-binding factor A